MKLQGHGTFNVPYRRRLSPNTGWAICSFRLARWDDRTWRGGQEGARGVKAVVQQRAREARVVHVERVVLGAAREVVAVRREPHEVLLVRVPGERAHAARRVHTPQLRTRTTCLLIILLVTG